MAQVTPGSPEDYRQQRDAVLAGLHAKTKGIPANLLKQVDQQAGAQFDAQWKAAGKDVPGTPEAGVNSLIANANQTRTENNQTIDNWLTGAQPQLQQAAWTANAQGGAVVNGLRGAADTANTAEADAINNMIAQNPGQVEAGAYGGDISSRAAGASADPNSIAYQNQALSKLSGLTDPNVTAKERFLEMQARQSEEQSRKAAMDAALADLSRRGIRSGGAEIAAMNGAQQTTSQNRMMQDLGTQAGAVDRSMQAIQGLGSLSSQQRQQSFGEQFQAGSAADDVAKFNSSQKQSYQQALDNFRAQQQTDQWGRTKDVTASQVAGAADQYGRAQNTAAASAGAAKDAYGRTADQIALGQSATGMKVGANQAGSQQVGQALQTGVGLSAEEQALAALNPPKSFLEKAQTFLGDPLKIKK